MFHAKSVVDGNYEFKMGSSYGRKQACESGENEGWCEFVVENGPKCGLTWFEDKCYPENTVMLSRRTEPCVKQNIL